MSDQRPSDDRLFATISATWPAAATVEAGPWLLREGRGGGKRVSAASAIGAWQEDDISAAEKAMRLMGQVPLFTLRPGDAALDAQLEARGYKAVDHTVIRAVRARDLTDQPLPRVTAFTIWEPLAIMREIWETGGIGERRQAIMDRVAQPKTGVFGRVSDSPGGTAFCAIHDGICMLHGLEILPHQRKKGLGGWMMRAAAFWAVDNGADWLAILVTKANVGGNALYASLGMEIVGEYHYRILTEPDES
ncbi:GNAT family N-acetyltransferase [Primorskyibacter sp. 2E107]|uniref:GNAT family N-acetyltransferase n=1 Tax=Primorskyibacter sp. 2E107 TaxID=3403458 RepID=UPI003AF9AE30